MTLAIFFSFLILTFLPCFHWQYYLLKWYYSTVFTFLFISIILCFPAWGIKQFQWKHYILGTIITFLTFHHTKSEVDGLYNLFIQRRKAWENITFRIPADEIWAHINTNTHILLLYRASLQTQSIDSTWKCLNSAQDYTNGAVVGFSSQETTLLSIKFFHEQQEGITLQQDIWMLQIIMHSKNFKSIFMPFCW